MRLRPRRCKLPGAALLLAAAGLAWGTAPPRPAGQEGAAELVRYQVRLEDEFGAFHAFDLDGDGRRDLIVIEVDRLQRDHRMQVSVFLQTDGGFARYAPPQPLPGDVALAGVGRFGRGPALALLRPGQLELWPWAGRRFDRASRQRTAVTSAFPVPANEVKRNVPWIEDLNGDGRHEVIVPRFDGLEVFTQRDDGTLVSLGHCRVRPHIRIWNSLTYRAVMHHIPTLHFIDLDGNGWRDLAAFSNDVLYWFLLDGQPRERREPHAVHDLAPPEPFDPEAPYDPPMRLVRAGDMNGDGLPDLVLAKNTPTDSSFKSTSRTLVYFGRPGDGGARVGYPDDADRVFVSEGFTLPILLDLDDDGGTDLVQVNVEVTFWNAVRALVTRTVSADAAYYLMGGDGGYPREPTELESYSVKFSLSRFGHQPIATWGDLNGDGLPDLLLSQEKDALGIHWGREGEVWHPDHDELLQDHLPIRQRRLHVSDLDGDGRDDLVLTYTRDDNRQMPETLRTLTVLMSRFRRPGSTVATSR